MKRNAGYTLLEIILVLTISGSAFIVGMRMYYTFKADNDARQVNANVDAIFNALSGYYRTNCYGNTQPNGTFVPGTLNPSAVPPPGALKSINIQVDLVTPGYFRGVLVQTPIVNASGSGLNGYVAQFNRLIYNQTTCTQGTGMANCTATTVTAQIISWQAQVAVQMNNTATARQMLGVLGADCLSSQAGATVLPCNLSGNNGTFVVWERTVANASKQGGSTYWGTLPTVKQFTQMYTLNPVTNQTSTSGASGTQFILCNN